MENRKVCHHCEGKGYIEIRDCVGDIQREETCSFCEGTGELEVRSTANAEKSELWKNNE
jgi:DnaJ-class molecular chaperone